MKTRPKLRSLSLSLLLLASAALPTRARAAFTLTLAQVGNNVVVTGSGTINTTGLSSFMPTSVPALIQPSGGFLIGGPTASTATGTFFGATGPLSFGTGTTQINPTLGTGNLVGIFGNSGFGALVYLPAGYTSGSALADSDTYANSTFATLGFTPGTYTYTFGGGANVDTLTVTSVASGVPEPSTWALLGLGVLGASVVTLRRRRVA